MTTPVQHIRALTSLGVVLSDLQKSVFPPRLARSQRPFSPPVAHMDNYLYTKYSHIYSLVATVVLLTAGSTQAAAAAVPALFETGWSNGKEPLDHHRVIKATCPNNTFIERWVVGVGDVDADNVDDCNSGRRIPLLSIVSIQGRCSNGTALPAIAGRNQASEKYDLNRHPSLSSPSGYSCLELEGYYYNLCRGGSWFMNFLGVGQELANGKAGSFLQFNCPPNSGPTEYVAVGYAGYSGAVADAINLMMAPVAVPTSNLTNATTARLQQHQAAQRQFHLPPQRQQGQQQQQQHRERHLPSRALVS